MSSASASALTNSSKVGVSAEAMFMPGARFVGGGCILVSSCMSPYRDGFFVFSESRTI